MGLVIKWFFPAAALCCITGAPVLAGGKPAVYVVNYPLKYFSERVAGENAEVFFPAPADVDPAYWMPDGETIAAYQKADLIVLNGANYAKWTGKVSLPRSKTVDTSKKFRDEYIISGEVATHSHGPAGKHAHESLAFTTWLDLDLAARQAGQIASALARVTPGKKEEFEKNHEALRKDLQEIDGQLRAMVKKAPGTPLVGSHPVYDYLARRYGLNLKSVHWEPHEAPGMEQWNKLKHLLGEHPAKWMVWESDPLPAVAAELEKMGVQSIVFDPAGNAPAQGDFLSVMRQNLANLKVAYDGVSP